MGESITQIWSGLRDAGMPDVMLFLPDGTACRSSWDETAMIGATRVALLGDQERKIVRVVPVESCIGIGVATPKGIDTSCYRGMIQSKLAERSSRPVPRPASSPAAPASGAPRPTVAVAAAGGHAPVAAVVGDVSANGSRTPG